MVAKTISVAVHPFVIALLMVWLIMSEYLSDKRIVATIGFFACVIVPLGACVLYEVLIKGRNADITDPKNRNIAYAVSISGIVLYAGIGMWWFGLPLPIALVSAGIVSSLVIAMLINRYFTKISIHVMIATYSSLCMFLLVSQTVGLIFFLMTLLVAWSRIKLKRHTLPQVVLGVFVPLIICGTLFYR